MAMAVSGGLGAVLRPGVCCVGGGDRPAGSGARVSATERAFFTGGGGLGLSAGAGVQAGRSRSQRRAARAGLAAFRQAFHGRVGVGARASGSLAVPAGRAKKQGRHGFALPSSGSRGVGGVVAAAAGEGSGAGAELVGRGHDWEVHKFGGTCMGGDKRIMMGAELVRNTIGSQRKAVVVSAMSGVTNSLILLISKATARDSSWKDELTLLGNQHRDVAEAVMDADDAAKFSAVLDENLVDLGSLLKAIAIAGQCTEQFQEFIVGHGELWSAQLMAGCLRAKGTPDVAWLDARDVLTVKPGGEEARLGMKSEGPSTTTVQVDWAASDGALDRWFARQSEKSAAGGGFNQNVVVITGFVCRTAEGVPTTLKRDGSDFSAAIFGALFRASGITIWTDVNGVYSADPRKVPEACQLARISYNEAWEMSYFGAQVLHPRTTEPAIMYDIPITIRNYFDVTNPGTIVGKYELSKVDTSSGDVDTNARKIVKGFATIDNVALVNVSGTGMVGQPGVAAAIFNAMAACNVNVIVISQGSSEHSVCFAIPGKDAQRAKSALEAEMALSAASRGAGSVGPNGKPWSEVIVIPDCAILSAVGEQMASVPGVSATFFRSLANNSVNVRAIAQGCSEYNVTAVINSVDLTRALRAVHSTFFLARTTLAVGIVGPGLIGKTLLEQIAQETEVHRSEFNMDIRVVGLANSKTMVVNELGIDADGWEEVLEGGEVADLVKFTELVDIDYLPNRVLVDCSASDYVAGFYEDWLRRGIHVITPNKKANSGPLAYYKALRTIQRKSYTHYFYETTVGAGLPLISTLQTLKLTGDKIKRIEGVFSGTLSFLFNTFDGSVPWSTVVSGAKDAGYTEPDPRDDLSGTDVQRKVCILCREIGIDIEMGEIPVRSLVPEALSGDDIDSATFLARLAEFDAGEGSIAAEVVAAREAGEIVRFVGVCDFETKSGTVELRRYPADHPFGSLKGADNIVSITTERYSKNPLVIQGPGAGPAVTAAGVFGDLCRVASYLGVPS